MATRCYPDFKEGEHMTRREYAVLLTINGKRITKIVIDPHYELKHAESIDDYIVLELVKLLSGSRFEPESEAGDFQYFVTDNLVLCEKNYRLIWLQELNESYVGIVNAYRRRG